MVCKYLVNPLFQLETEKMLKPQIQVIKLFRGVYKLDGGEKIANIMIIIIFSIVFGYDWYSTGSGYVELSKI